MIMQIIVAAASLALAEPVAAQESCPRASLLCLDGDGLPLAGDGLPPRVAAGARIDVKVIGCRAKQALYRVVEESVVGRERLFRETSASPPESLAGKRRPGECSPEVIESFRVTVPTDARMSTFSVVFTREGAAAADGTRKVERRESYSAQIDHGRYYLDIGVLFPVVVGGERRVVAEETDAPETTRLRVREDLDVFPALMLHVFPGGRDLAAISSFKVGACQGTSAFSGATDCRAHRHRRRAANALGLQVGVELDFRRFDRYFFGGLFEPVSGLSISAGLALTRLEYIRRGFADGAEVPTPMTKTSEGEVDLSRYTERSWAPRFYVGVTLSFDIVRTLAERRRSDAAKSVFTE